MWNEGPPSATVSSSGQAATGDGAASGRAAIVSGGSGGVGLVIARQLLRRGFGVTVLGRDASRLETARQEILSEATSPKALQVVIADATSAVDLDSAVQAHLDHFNRLDVLVNVVGRSDRGRLDSLDAQTLRDLFEANVVSALLGSQACLPALRQSRGVIVNIGSLASRVAPRYLGGYVVVKHALAGMTRQMRLECQADGVHVGLVCPGPIEGSHGENRYGVDQSSGVPATAARPGGGAKITRLTPEEVADAVLRCVDERAIEIVLPGKTRFLMAINAFFPAWADRILSRKTSG